MINEAFENEDTINEDTINEDIALNQSESLEIIQYYKNEFSKCEEENKELKNKLGEKNEECDGLVRRIKILENLNSKLIEREQNQKSQMEELMDTFRHFEEQDELLKISRRGEKDLEEKLNKAYESIQLLSMEKELDK
jgi:hypothetical protein